MKARSRKAESEIGKRAAAHTSGLAGGESGTESGCKKGSSRKRDTKVVLSRTRGKSNLDRVVSGDRVGEPNGEKSVHESTIDALVRVRKDGSGQPPLPIPIATFSI